MEDLIFGKEKLLKEDRKIVNCYSKKLFIIYWVLAKNIDYLAHCKHLYHYLMVFFITELTEIIFTLVLKFNGKKTMWHEFDRCTIRT